jgi:2',3'-cyclic-nucleotide 2'-phosphodiesterase (5'-nucleotidase family)
VRALGNVIGKLDGELRKATVGAGSLGNFVTDALRAQASRKLGHPVSLMITNSGGLRKSAIAPGDLRASDIFELMPFENALIELEMNGKQLLRLLEIVVEGRDAQSGARIRYKMDEKMNPEFVSAKLLDAKRREIRINPTAKYRVVTIDYLLRLGSGDYAILQEAKGVKPLGITMRDAMMDYVKSETAKGRTIKSKLDGRFVDVAKTEGQR